MENNKIKPEEIDGYTYATFLETHFSDVPNYLRNELSYIFNYCLTDAARKDLQNFAASHMNNEEND